MSLSLLCTKKNACIWENLFCHLLCVTNSSVLSLSLAGTTGGLLGYFSAGTSLGEPYSIYVHWWHSLFWHNWSNVFLCFYCFTVLYYLYSNSSFMLSQWDSEVINLEQRLICTTTTNTVKQCSIVPSSNSWYFVNQWSGAITCINLYRGLHF